MTAPPRRSTSSRPSRSPTIPNAATGTAPWRSAWPRSSSPGCACSPAPGCGRARSSSTPTTTASRGPGTPLGLIADVLTPVGRALVHGDRPQRLPALDPARHHVLPARGTGGVLPAVPDARAGRRPDPARWRHLRRAVREPRPRRHRRRARRPARPPVVRHPGRRAGDGAVRRLPRVVRALVRLRRGAADRARRRLPAVPHRRAVAARRRRGRARHGDPPERHRPRRRVRGRRRASRSTAAATGCR